MLLVDPSAALCQPVEGICAFSPEQIGEARALAIELRSSARPAARAGELRAALSSLLAPRQATTRAQMDERIIRTLSRLDAPESANWSLEELARDASLSPGRLRHLFRAEVGLPMRSYRLWARLRAAVSSIAVNPNLTRAAHEAGFADSAHLSRAFRSLFGLAPSTLQRGVEIAILDS